MSRSIGLGRGFEKAFSISTLAMLLLTVSWAAEAQGWPARPITLIMPFSAGGSTDLYGRALAEFVSRKYGYTIVVDNRPGAGGLIGLNAVKQAPPDGYTLGYFGSTNLIA